jgi:two-component system, OmpR family, response regulator
MTLSARVLVVDDSEVVLNRVQQRLSLEGYQVTTTTQTIGIARLLRDVAMVLIDYHMPGIDGKSLLDSLKSAVAQSKTNPPAFYLYTYDQEVGARALTLGFDGCFTRKGDDDALVAQLDAALRQQRLKRISVRNRRKE